MHKLTSFFRGPAPRPAIVAVLFCAAPVCTSSQPTDTESSDTDSGTDSDSATDVGSDSATAPDGRTLWKAIEAGGGFSCGLTLAGEIRCFGAVGYNDGRASDAPPGAGYKEISTGTRAACAIDAQDQVACWGHAVVGIMDVPQDKVRGVSVGRNSACAIRLADDEPVCWGEGFSGGPVVPSGPADEVSVGGTATCVLRAGRVRCVGIPPWNPVWDYDLPRWTQEPDPSLIFKNIDSGADDACGVLVDGSLHCWGQRQVGDEDLVQAALPAGPGFADIRIDVATACALYEDGRPLCWGIHGIDWIPVPSGTVLTAISHGLGHACGLEPAGTALCWGSNREGQLDVP